MKPFQILAPALLSIGLLSVSGGAAAAFEIPTKSVLLVFGKGWYVDSHKAIDSLQREVDKVCNPAVFKVSWPRGGANFESKRINNKNYFKYNARVVCTLKKDLQ